MQQFIMFTELLTATQSWDKHPNMKLASRPFPSIPMWYIVCLQWRNYIVYNNKDQTSLYDIVTWMGFKEPILVFKLHSTLRASGYY